MVSSVDALNGTRIESDHEKFLLSGSILGALSQAKGLTIPISECLYKESGEWKSVAYYPDLYMQYNWGGYYMNCTYVTKDSKGRYLYSFPILDKVLRYNNDFSLCDTIPMKSRYDKALKNLHLTVQKMKLMKSVTISAKLLIPILYMILTGIST